MIIRQIIFAVLLPIIVCNARAQSADEAWQTGSFEISATPTEIVGPEAAANFAAIVPPGKSINWQIVVPETYDPSDPPGLLIYISPSDSGRLPRQWNGLADTHNLIWAAADQSGNEIEVARRITYTLFGVGLISSRYKIKPQRVYLSGFSGGARVAGLVAAAYPQVFRGDIYIGGAEFWENEPSAGKLDVMKRNRHVFLVGTDDFNRRMSNQVANKYEDAGIKNIKRMIISRRGHALPDIGDMTIALNYLDGIADQQ